MGDLCSLDCAVFSQRKVMIQIPKNAEYFVTCDLETTGTDVMRCDWITGSFGKIRISDFQTLSELELKSRPENHWCEEARKTHRLSVHTANEFPGRRESLSKLIEWLPPRESFIFVCHANPAPWIEFGNFGRGRHNSHFDLSMIKWDFFMQDRFFDFHKYFDEKNVISTQTIGREFFGLSKELNLEQMCAKLGIKMNGEHHDARADRKASEQILRKYLHDTNFQNVRKRHSKFNPTIPQIQENIGLEEQQRFNF